MRRKEVAATLVFWAFAGFVFAELDVKADWARAKTIAPGILLAHISFKEPLIEGDVMRIDLKTPGLKFHATEAAQKWGEPIPGYGKNKITTKAERTSDFLERIRGGEKSRAKLNAVAAVNTMPWEPFPCTNEHVQAIGIAVSKGKLVSTHGYPAVFVAYKDGTVSITNRIDTSDISNVEVAASGFGLLLDPNGDYLAKYNESRHPRTAFGLSGDGRYLYWLTVDGRQENYSMGASLRDLAEMLRSLGSKSAMNLDGGGSTSLCYWDKDRLEVITASHSVSRSNKYQRKVAFNIAVSVK